MNRFFRWYTGALLVLGAVIFTCSISDAQSISLSVKKLTDSTSRVTATMPQLCIKATGFCPNEYHFSWTRQGEVALVSEWRRPANHSGSLTDAFTTITRPGDTTVIGITITAGNGTSRKATTKIWRAVDPLVAARDSFPARLFRIVPLTQSGSKYVGIGEYVGMCALWKSRYTGEVRVDVGANSSSEQRASILIMCESAAAKYESERSM